MEVRHRRLADAGEIESKGVAGGMTGQDLVRSAGDDGAAGGGGWIVHDDASQGLAAGIGRWVVDQNSSVTIGNRRAPVGRIRADYQVHGGVACLADGNNAARFKPNITDGSTGVEASHIHDIGRG